MIRKLFNRIFAPRHPWRTVSFSELSELYLASFLRTLAIGLIGIFVPIYLYQQHYTITQIFLFYSIFFGIGPINDFLVGYLITKTGPKHVMRISFLLQAIYLFMLVNIQNFPFGLMLSALMGSIATTMYWLSYNVDFSEIKHNKHAGKELGFLHMLEKTAAVIAPVLGGLIATIAGMRSVFVIATVAMFLAALIILISPEPVGYDNKFTFRRLKGRYLYRNIAAFGFYCGENAISVMIWPLFLALVVFSSGVYLKIGVIASIPVITTILIAVPLGRLLDDRKGAAMITYGTTINSILHILRVGVSSVFGASLIAFTNEPNTMMYRLAFSKGYYDETDDKKDNRVMYVVVNEAIADVVRSGTFILFMILSLHFNIRTVCIIAFILAALYSQLIRLERYPALKS